MCVSMLVLMMGMTALKFSSPAHVELWLRQAELCLLS